MGNEGIGMEKVTVEMKVYVIRTNEKGFGNCYHGKDGVCERNPVNAIKYETFEAARKAVGEPDATFPVHEIIPMTIEYTIYEEYKTVIEPFLEDDE